jgi:AraC-like DNA-binding protein
VVYLPYEDHGYASDPAIALSVTAVSFEYAASSALSANLQRLGRRRHFRGLKEAVALLDPIRHNHASGREFRLRAAECMVESLLFAMIGECDRRRASDRTSPVDEAMELLFSEHGARLTAIADKLGVSPEAIRKEFRRHFGDAPMHYFRSYRVSHIARRLGASDTPLRELAEEFGFYDEFHMSRIFKREMGVSPSEYRARHRP